MDRQCGVTDDSREGVTEGGVGGVTEVGAGEMTEDGVGVALRDGWARCDRCGAERVGLSFSVVHSNRIVVPVEAMD